uniref:Mitochondrial inner membrane protease subunit 2 n=1 Tax=Ditylenchus dipsaci TaxID=166011 RepID=A0A915EBF0_9BILA
MSWLGKVGSGLGIICIPITLWICGHPSYVIGSSMQPTLSGTDAKWWKRDVVWINRYARYSQPQLGDVIAFIYPQDPKKTHIKRIAHGPGTIITSEGNKIVQIVPENHYWMVSDNPYRANDSNLYGPVNQGLFKGKATYVLWPPEHWRKI